MEVACRATVGESRGPSARAVSTLSVAASSASLQVAAGAPESPLVSNEHTTLTHVQRARIEANRRQALQRRALKPINGNLIEANRSISGKKICGKPSGIMQEDRHPSTHTAPSVPPRNMNAELPRSNSEEEESEVAPTQREADFMVMALELTERRCAGVHHERTGERSPGRATATLPLSSFSPTLLANNPITIEKESGMDELRMSGHGEDVRSAATEGEVFDGMEGEGTGAKRRRSGDDEVKPCNGGEAHQTTTHTSDWVECVDLVSPGFDGGGKEADGAAGARAALAGNKQVELVRRKAARLGGKVRDPVAIARVRAPFKAPRTVTNVAASREVRDEVANGGDAENCYRAQCRQAMELTAGERADDPEDADSSDRLTPCSQKSWGGTAGTEKEDMAGDERSLWKKGPEESVVAGVSEDIDDVDNELTPESQKSAPCRSPEALKRVREEPAGKEAESRDEISRTDSPNRHAEHVRPEVEQARKWIENGSIDGSMEDQALSGPNLPAPAKRVCAVPTMVEEAGSNCGREVSGGQKYVCMSPTCEGDQSVRVRAASLPRLPTEKEAADMEAEQVDDELLRQLDLIEARHIPKPKAAPEVGPNPHSGKDMAPLCWELCAHLGDAARGGQEDREKEAGADADAKASKKKEKEKEAGADADAKASHAVGADVNTDLVLDAAFLVELDKIEAKRPGTGQELHTGRGPGCGYLESREFAEELRLHAVSKRKRDSDEVIEIQPEPDRSDSKVSGNSEPAQLLRQCTGQGEHITECERHDHAEEFDITGTWPRAESMPSPSTNGCDSLRQGMAVLEAKLKWSPRVLPVLDIDVTDFTSEFARGLDAGEGECEADLSEQYGSGTRLVSDGGGLLLEKEEMCSEQARIMSHAVSEGGQELSEQRHMVEGPVDPRRLGEVEDEVEDQELNGENDRMCHCGSGRRYLTCHGLYVCDFKCGFKGKEVGMNGRLTPYPTQTGAYDVVAAHEATCPRAPTPSRAESATKSTAKCCEVARGDASSWMQPCHALPSSAGARCPSAAQQMAQKEGGKESVASGAGDPEAESGSARIGSEGECTSVLRHEDDRQDDLSTRNKEHLQPTLSPEGRGGVKEDRDKADNPECHGRRDCGLNEEQRRAAFYTAREPLMILAGAGSGKTKTLISRIQFLKEQGIDLGRMLVLTFSTAATKELSQRIAKAFPGKKKDCEITVSTFHSFGLQVCRKFAAALGLPDDFVIFSGGRQRKVVTAGLLHFKTRNNGAATAGAEKAAGAAENGVVDKSVVRRVCMELTKVLASATGPEGAPGHATMSDELAFVYKYYKETLLQCKSLDFSSFIGEAARLLRTHAEAKAYYGNLYHHVLVDEFQDTSAAQFELVSSLAPHGSVTVVGDDDQTIFGFNGSNHKNFDLFRARYPGFSEVRLERNYRSSGVIVDAARSLIEHNKLRCCKSARAVAPPGERIKVVECRNERCEVSFIVGQIKQKHAEGAAYKDIAILYRTQKTGRSFQEELRRHKIPFNVHGVSFWRRKVVKNIVAVLRLVKNQGDDQAFRRLLKAFLLQNKEAAKRILEQLEKQAISRRTSLWVQGKAHLQEKVSGALSGKQLSMGRKMISTVESFIILAPRFPCMSDFVDTILQRMPQAHKYEEGIGQDESVTLLNEDKDKRTVRDVLMHYIATFEAQYVAAQVGEREPAREDARLQLSTSPALAGRPAASAAGEGKGPRRSQCVETIAAFLDFQVVEEAECNRKIKEDNDNSVTISTIHQSKGLEWVHVYIVRFNAGEMPLCNNVHAELRELEMEEERRLCYVGLTRAKSSLVLSHVSTLQQQMLEPSPFLREIPSHLLEHTSAYDLAQQAGGSNAQAAMEAGDDADAHPGEDLLPIEGFFSCGFLLRFEVTQRASVSGQFRRWARTSSFKDPAALVGKVKAVVYESLASKKTKNKAVLKLLLPMLQQPQEGTPCLPTASALAFAREMICMEQAPEHVREQRKAARARHFAANNARTGMENKPPTEKQLSYLRALGCPKQPSSMMECAALIDRYKQM